ncbi:hypothetical protein ACFYPA_36870 [Streptomyces sp. NPDC005775]|uniref:hypothetical protein n=1 Tax=unclassified Streptomyces TaxID=2593676 RepID=UPI003409DFCD
MIETVVQIFTQVAGGTVAAVGSGVGQLVSDLVRERLAGSESGRLAIQAAEAQPADPAAAAELRALLQAEVDADPDFARQIVAALSTGSTPAEPPRQVSGSITIDGSTVRGRNTISLGPVTFNNTRNARYSLLAAALVLVALVAVGLYGGSRLITGDDPGRQKSVTQLSDAVAYQVLPDLASLPEGWTQPEAADVGGSHLPESAGLSYLGTADFLMGDSEADLHISVAAFTTAEKAHALYLKTEEDNSEDGSGLSVSLPRVGDESSAESHPSGNGEESGSSVSLRVGTVLMFITGDDIDGRPFNGTWLKDLGKMMAERAQQAQNGQEPTASARNA